MRLIRHINERADIMGEGEYGEIDDFNEVIQSQCKPYLKLISQSREPLYRGVAGVPADSFGSKTVRQDRRTKMMDDKAAAYLNNWLGKNGFARRDKSVMCSPSEDLLKLFGPSFYIFPVGKFKYTWIESVDMNFVDSKSGWRPEAPYAFMQTKTIGPEHLEGEKVLINMRKPFKEYFHKDKFMDGYNKGYEFWFECSQYYFAPLGTYVWDHKYKALV